MKKDETTDRHLDEFWRRRARLITGGVTGLRKAADSAANEKDRQRSVAQEIGRLAAHGISIRLYQEPQRRKRPAVVLRGSIETINPGPLREQQLQVIYGEKEVTASYRGHAGDEEPAWDEPSTKSCVRWVDEENETMAAETPESVHGRLESIEDAVRRLSEPGPLGTMLATAPEAAMLRRAGMNIDWATRQIGRWSAAGKSARLGDLSREIWKLSDARLELEWGEDTRLTRVEIIHEEDRIRQLEQSNRADIERGRPGILELVVKRGMKSGSQRLEVRLRLLNPGTPEETFEGNDWGHAVLSEIEERGRNLNETGIEAGLLAIAAHPEAKTEAAAGAAIRKAEGPGSWTALAKEQP